MSRTFKYYHNVRNEVRLTFLFPSVDSRFVDFCLNGVNSL